MSISNDSSFVSSIDLDIKYSVYANQLISTRYLTSSKPTLVYEYIIFSELLMFRSICCLPLVVVVLPIKSFGILIILGDLKAILVFW